MFCSIRHGLSADKLSCTVHFIEQDVTTNRNFYNFKIGFLYFKYRNYCILNAENYLILRIASWTRPHTTVVGLAATDVPSFADYFRRFISSPYFRPTPLLNVACQSLSSACSVQVR